MLLCGIRNSYMAYTHAQVRPTSIRMTQHRIVLSALRLLLLIGHLSRFQLVLSACSTIKALSTKVITPQHIHALPDTNSSIAYFNWWSDNQVNAPFYGGYMAALAVSGGDSIIASDAGTDSYAQYVIYKRGKPVKVVLINTDYYSGTGERSSTTFQLTGLGNNGNLKATRLTAPSSETYTGLNQGNPALGPTIGGTRPSPLP